MTAEAQPKVGQKVSVWTDAGEHVFTGEIEVVDNLKPDKTRIEIVERKGAPEDAVPT